MGGGPSKEEKAAAAAADRRAQEQAALQREYMAAASKPDPLEERLKAQDMNWLDWSEGKQGPIDVTRAPGLGPSLNLYERAAAGQQGEKMGLGALRMGEQASNPNLAALLSEQAKSHREQEAAGGLERAVGMRDAEVKGSALPLLGLAQNRTMGLANLGSNNANTSQGQYLGFLSSRPQRPSFWRSFSQSFANTLGNTFGGGNAGGSGYFGTGP